jgi:hypothetical protein
MSLVAASEPPETTAGRAFFLLLLFGLCVWLIRTGLDRDKNVRLVVGILLAIAFVAVAVPQFLSHL